MAHTVIHCLRQILAPGCLPLFVLFSFLDTRFPLIVH
jgi:hypothetical protein